MREERQERLSHDKRRGVRRDIVMLIFAASQLDRAAGETSD